MQSKRDKPDVDEYIDFLKTQAENFHQAFTINLDFQQDTNFLLIRNRLLLILNNIVKDKRHRQRCFYVLHIVQNLVNKFDLPCENIEEKCRLLLYFVFFICEKFEAFLPMNYLNISSIETYSSTIKIITTIERMLLVTLKFPRFSNEEIFRCFLSLNSHIITGAELEEYNNSLNSLLNYALSEEILFSNYDQFTISCAIMLLSAEANDQLDLKNNIWNMIKPFVRDIKIIERCAFEIRKRVFDEPSQETEDLSEGIETQQDTQITVTPERKKPSKENKKRNKENLKLRGHKKVNKLRKR